MTSKKIYQKDKELITVNDKFIYCSSVYLLWKGGAALQEEKYYASDKPIKLKKKNIKIKGKGYTVFNFFNLEFAPEKWLIQNGWKLITI